MSANETTGAAGASGAAGTQSSNRELRPPRTRYRPIRGNQVAIVGGHPAAVASGARMLDRGGNAVDAIIAAAAALTVVRPHMCGIGGDGFLLIHDARSGRIQAVNAGGPAPAAAHPDRFPGGIPNEGPHISTVPGIVDGWGIAHERFGSLPWSDLLQPAIELAERGFPVYESLAGWIRHYRRKYAADPACAAVLLPQGRPPEVGEILVQADLAKSLKRLAKNGPRELYEGELAATYANYLQAAGGLTTAEDLARYHAEWREPVTGAYRGHVVHTQPPMSQGWMVVQMLSALEGVDVASLGFGSGGLVATLARLVGASFDDRQRRFGDPKFVDFALDMVLSRARIEEIRREVAEAAGGRSGLAIPAGGAGDTTSLSAVDAAGNAVSMIQSLWVDAGVMVPGTGILLNARLNSCSVTPGHPDVVMGGKTPAYTMHTYVVTRDGRPVIVGGTPGGNTQVQTNLQVLTNLIDFGLNPQATVEAPRFAVGGLHYARASAIYLESRFSEEVRSTLAAQGFDVTLLSDWAEIEVEGQSPATVGSAKIIGIDPETGTRAVGADPRREAHGIVW